MHEAHPLFEIAGVGVTSVMVTMLMITVLLSVIAIVGSRRLADVPHGLQNALEILLESVEGFFAGVMGAKLARTYLPLICTLFLFILLSNYSGLLPMAGHLPGLAAPTSSLSVTAGLAAITFFFTHFYGLREHKLKYFKHFFQPIAIMFPIMLIEEVARPLSLSLRLYGNILGEETVASQIFGMVPFLVPLPLTFLSLLLGLVQTAVFTILTSIYISGAVGDGH